MRFKKQARTCSSSKLIQRKSNKNNVKKKNVKNMKQIPQKNCTSS